MEKSKFYNRIIKFLAGLIVMSAGTAALAAEPGMAGSFPLAAVDKLPPPPPVKKPDLSVLVDQFIAQGHEIAALKQQMEVNKHTLKTLSEKVDTLGSNR